MLKVAEVLLCLTVMHSAHADYFTDLKDKRVKSDTKVSWEQYGPGNAGFANLLKYHPTKPNVCFTSPDMGNTYQTDNNGKTWYTVKDVDGSADFQRINDVQYSPKKSHIGYAIECSRLYKTTNTGKSWSVIKGCSWYTKDRAGNETRSWHRKVSALAIDPKNENVIYVGGGAHPRGQQHLGWNSLTKANASNPRGASNSYSGKIWRSTDSGQSWTNVSDGLHAKAQFCRIIVNPKNSNTVYAASTHGLYRSWNRGKKWHQIGKNGFDNNTIMDMDVYYHKTAKSEEFVLYAIDQVRYYKDRANKTTTNNGGIFKSEDGGTSWTKINKAGTHEGLYLNLNKLTGGTSYNYKKYISKWLNLSITEINANYNKLPKTALQYFNLINVDPSDKDTLYVGFYDAQIKYSILPGRLWKTADRGKKWTSVARNVSAAWNKDKKYWQSRGNPITDNMTEGHLLGDVQFNNDYGQRSARHFSVNSRGDLMLLYAHNTFLSTDKGISWKQVDEDHTSKGNVMGRGNSNHPGSCIFQDKRLGKGITYLGSGEHNLWRTANDGTKGRQAVTFLEHSEETVFAVATHPWNEKTVYTTSMRQRNMDKIMRSTDSGKTWKAWGKATDGIEYFRTNDLTIDPVNPNYMYFGVNITDGKDKEAKRVGGFFFSSDGGKKFIKRNNGLPAMPWVVDIEFEPGDNDHSNLYAAVQYNLNEKKKGGLYRTENRGKQWSKIAIPSEIEGVNSITFDHSGRMYITAGRRGGAFKSGGIWWSDNKGKNWTRIFKGKFVFKFDVSPFDRNRIICTQDELTKNPGFYISEDRGKTWSKNNKTIGQPNKITDIEFDIHDPNLIHMTVLGSGFLKGTYTNGVRPITLKPATLQIAINQSIQLRTTTTSIIDRSKITYKSSNPAIVSVTSTGKIKGIKRGAAKVYAISGNKRYSDFIPVVVKSTPHVSPIPEQQAYPSGIPHTIPGNIQAENYDKGGKGIAFSDTDSLNKSGKYRTDEVDIEECSEGGYNISYIKAHEWLEYSVVIAEAGKYDFYIRSAAPFSQGTIRILLDGKNISEKVTLPVTGGWQKYKSTKTNVTLPKGKHILRIYMETAGFNINKFYIGKAGVASAAQPARQQQAIATKTKKYTVTFDPGIDADYTGDLKQTVSHGNAAVAPVIKPYEFVKFSGWDRSFSNVTKNIAISATYSTVIPEDYLPPANKDLHLWLDAGVRAVTDNSGIITKWQNLVTQQYLEPRGAKHIVLGTDKNNIPAIHFDGESYITLNNPERNDSPVTVFVVYARQATEAKEYKWQRVLSSIDRDVNADNKGRGFLCGTGKDINDIATTVFTYKNSLSSLKQLCIGANGNDYKQRFNGDIFEILIYKRELTNKEINSVKEYLSEKWLPNK